MSDLRSKIADIIWSQKPGGGDQGLCLKTADRIILELRLATELAAAERARIVAEHWKTQALPLLQEGKSEWGLVTHSMSLVLSALDGEADPDQLGILSGHPDAERIREAGK